MASKEIPLHPALVRNLRIIARTDTEQARKIKPIFENINQQLLDNCRMHTLYDNQGNELVSSLFTKISTTDLHRGSTEKPSQSIAILPGFSLPGSGTPVDNERIRLAADIIGHAMVNTQEITVFLYGLFISRGSRISPAWVEKLRTDGFKQHALVYAESISREDNANPTIVYGESMGSINAKHTAEKLRSSGREVALFVQNPPGAETNLPAWLKKGQVVAGYSGETITRRTIKKFERVTPKTKEEKPFFHAFYDHLEKQGTIIPEDTHQKTLKWQEALIDLNHLLQEIPFSTEGIIVPTIVDYGWKDPTSFTFGRMKKWRNGERRSQQHNITYNLSNFAHTPEYNPMLWTTLQATHT